MLYESNWKYWMPDQNVRIAQYALKLLSDFRTTALTPTLPMAKDAIAGNDNLKIQKANCQLLFLQCVKDVVYMQTWLHKIWNQV